MTGRVLGVVSLGLFGGCLTDKEVVALEAQKAESAVDADTNADTDTDTDAGSTYSEGEYVDELGMEMIQVPSGSFWMGSTEGDTDEDPVHAVTLTHGFWMAKTELTQTVWAAVMAASPSYHTGCDSCPVEQVTWGEVAIFANVLSTAEGLGPCYIEDGMDLTKGYLENPYACPGYRLPTEAEWEYGARAGEGTEYAGSDLSADVAWTSETSTYETHEVCTESLQTNAWGLCDMSGNVWEWTNDWYDPAYYEVSPSDDPPGPGVGSSRATRGGGFANPVVDARVTSRGDAYSPSAGGDDLGFRLVRSLDP